jgi:hypothetical protein
VRKYRRIFSEATTTHEEYVMCKFKSAIVLQDKREKGGFKLLLSPWTESHSELIIIHKLRDDGRIRFARVEYSPESMDKAHMLDTYKLRIDEERRPEWFSEEMKENVAAKLCAYVKSIIVDGDVALLIGGQFIIAPGARVESAHSMVINAICGGTVSEIRGGTVSEIWGGTVSAIWERFNGLIGPIGSGANVTDNRKKST